MPIAPKAYIDSLTGVQQALLEVEGLGFGGSQFLADVPASTDNRGNVGRTLAHLLGQLTPCLLWAQQYKKIR